MIDTHYCNVSAGKNTERLLTHSCLQPNTPLSKSLRICGQKVLDRGLVVELLVDRQYLSLASVLLRSQFCPVDNMSYSGDHFATLSATFEKFRPQGAVPRPKLVDSY